jgi:hypothetical protein
MLITQHSAALLQHFARKQLGLSQLPLGCEQGTHVVDAGQRVRMLFALHAAALLQRLAQVRFGLSQLALESE